MPQDVSIVNDLKTAAVLAGSAGLLGAATVPLLLPSISELVPPVPVVLTAEPAVAPDGADRDGIARGEGAESPPRG